MARKETDLYEKNLSIYRELMTKDKEAALKLFGVTLINSISPAERALAMRDWGSETVSPVDLYNLGCHFAAQQNFGEAILHFKRAIEIDPNLIDAIYNLAVCYEKAGHIPQARSTWDVFVGVTKDEAEKSRTRDHVASLAG
jgi:tetratricopeptide (TPR) repeat protein